MMRERCIRCTAVGRLFVPLAVSNPRAYTEGYTAAAATVRVIRRNLLPQRWGPTDPVGAAVARAIADCNRCGKAVQGVNPRGGLAAAVAIGARMRLSEVKVVSPVIVKVEVEVVAAHLAPLRLATRVVIGAVITKIVVITVVTSIAIIYASLNLLCGGGSVVVIAVIVVGCRGSAVVSSVVVVNFIVIVVVIAPSTVIVAAPVPVLVIVVPSVVVGHVVVIVGIVAGVGCHRQGGGGIHVARVVCAAVVVAAARRCCECHRRRHRRL